MIYFSGNKKIKTKGFTLVEMLVYLAIFLITSVASVGFMISLDDFIDEYRLETVLFRSGTNAMEQITLALRQADSVDLLNTVQDTPSAGQLTVENTATTTEFLLSSGEVLLTINSTDYGSLISDQVTVNGFTVYHYPIGTDGELVRVKLTLTGTVGSISKTIHLYGGSVIRGAI